MKNFYVFLIFFFSLSCQHRILKVDLEQKSDLCEQSITVVDKRLDKDISMLFAGYAGAHISYFEIKPQIEEYLKQNICEKLNTKQTDPIDISIEGLDLKSKVGFGGTNELKCVMRTTVQIGSKIPLNIDTVYIDDKDMSSLISTAFTKVIAGCIEANASSTAKINR